MTPQTKPENTLPSLPDQAVTMDGQRYYPPKDEWKFNHPSRIEKINFRPLSGIATPKMILHLKTFLKGILEHFSCVWASSSGRTLVRVLKRAKEQNAEPIAEIDIVHLLTLPPTSLRVIRPLLLRWHKSGIPGVSDQADICLKEQNIPRERDAAILNSDPEGGALEEQELLMLLQALKTALATGKMDTDTYLMVLLLTMFCPRPSQAVLLRCSDLTQSQGRYYIRIPSLKNRRPVRTEFYKRPLAPAFAALLSAHINERMAAQPGQPAEEDVSMFRWPNGLSLHDCLRNLAKGPLKIICERTNAPIVLTATRIRHTVATRAAEEGYGSMYIAELLDHTNQSSAQVYVDARPTQEERITAATAAHLGPLAQAFAGKLVANESLASRGAEPASRVGSPETGNVGTCGKHGFCGGLAPIACYTCVSFQPWMDAPHEALLAAMHRDRQRALDESGDARYSMVNDLTIKAVAHVVEMCRTAREVQI